ncbi:oxygen-independent coproporphyrinogen III oxidase [Phenylobacterium sp.]|uniref:oxygen-independent coproporphyrinogen III oxidase n=1 Tax=Phenylobacterium sp. TaxID=1871053 RepID=UPI0025E7D51F|nr:oxygen-independent coproporphyrinogen III oxidase [Phenylobacterium sp.]|tara:strand:+ start:9037 stop:10419 length:1383 start_codon:yes stop_codon:yes gene_type:complete
MALAKVAPLRFDIDRVLKHDGRAPRYTSYPTAVQFSTDIGPVEYCDWLTGLPQDGAVSLYVHVPFCTRLCWYCGCNTRVVNRPEPIGEYVRYLLREVALVARKLDGRRSASAIHLGGGTPNTLTVDELQAIFRALGREFAFVDDMEIAAELDPASLTRSWVDAAGALGMNRASLGVQTLDPKVQAAVNRTETFEQIEECVAALRAIRVRSLNLDLMYGLPHQTTQSVLDTIDAVLKFRPERLALFGYAHVPWMKSHQKLIAESALPGPAERLEQALTAEEKLVGEGYVSIGLDHFALPHDDLARAKADNRLRRNFQGYTTDAAKTLIGFGASAIGALPEGYIQNHAQELSWRQAIDRGEAPIARGVTATDDDRFRAEIIERLMCDFAVDLEAVGGRHRNGSIPDLDEAMARLRPFLEDRFISIEGRRIEVLPAGRPLVRSISACFDAYLQPDALRHSRAV